MLQVHVGQQGKDCFRLCMYIQYRVCEMHNFNVTGMHGTKKRNVFFCIQCHVV